MLSKDPVSSRLESNGISYTEFSYQVLQDYDFLELFRRNYCTMQIGGSDQWGNIVAGLDLIRRVEQGSGHALTVPLLMKADGLDPKAMRYVAFDGGGESIAALLGGSIQVYTGDVAEMTAHLDAGTMRILAVMSPERLPAPFDVFPTAKEQGYDAEWIILRGFYMGKNVSDEAYNAWADAFKRAYATPEFAAIQKDKGLLPLNMAGAEFDADAKARIGKMTEIAKEAGLIQ